MIQLFNKLTQIFINTIECLTIVDDGIKQTSQVAEELWNFDRKTTYIVASFRSLFLSWGSGIASNPENLELDIIDVPAMISALLDIRSQLFKVTKSSGPLPFFELVKVLINIRHGL